MKIKSKMKLKKNVELNEIKLLKRIVSVCSRLLEIKTFNSNGMKTNFLLQKKRTKWDEKKNKFVFI